MTLIKNPYIYSPLIGGILSGLFFWIYAVVIIIEELNKLSSFSTYELIKTSLLLLPLIFAITTSISYICFYPLNFINKIIQNKFKIKEGLTWAISFILGLIIGITIVSLSHNYEQTVRSYLIIGCFSFGALFNASLFSVLSNKIASIK